MPNDKFKKVFGSDDWIAFFASQAIDPVSADPALKPFFVVWTHATILDEPVVKYLLSTICEYIDEFDAAGKLFGIIEICDFVEAVKHIFHPLEFLYDHGQRISYLNKFFLNTWNGKTEPFPALEGKRLLMIQTLDEKMESEMIKKSKGILPIQEAFDPLANLASLRKLRGKVGK